VYTDRPEIIPNIRAAAHRESNRDVLSFVFSHNPDRFYGRKHLLPMRVIRFVPTNNTNGHVYLYYWPIPSGSRLFYQKPFLRDVPRNTWLNRAPLRIVFPVHISKTIYRPLEFIIEIRPCNTSYAEINETIPNVQSRVSRYVVRSFYLLRNQLRMYVYKLFAETVIDLTFWFVRVSARLYLRSYFRQNNEFTSLCSNARYWMSIEPKKSNTISLRNTKRLSKRKSPTTNSLLVVARRRLFKSVRIKYVCNFIIIRNQYTFYVTYNSFGVSNRLSSQVWDIYIYINSTYFYWA